MLVGLVLISVSYATIPPPVAASPARKPSARDTEDGGKLHDKDAYGKEVRIHVNKSTKTEGAVKWAIKSRHNDPDGHAKSQGCK